MGWDRGNWLANLRAHAFVWSRTQLRHDAERSAPRRVAALPEFRRRRSERRSPLDRRAGAVSMMFRIVAAFFIVTFAPSASAQPYVGLAFGQAKYIDACAGVPSSITCSGSDTSLSMFGGYKFNPHFAAPAD